MEVSKLYKELQNREANVYMIDYQHLKAKIEGDSQIFVY